MAGNLESFDAKALSDGALACIALKRTIRNRHTEFLMAKSWYPTGVMVVVECPDMDRRSGVPFECSRPANSGLGHAVRPAAEVAGFEAIAENCRVAEHGDASPIVDEPESKDDVALVVEAAGLSRSPV